MLCTKSQGPGQPGLTLGFSLHGRRKAILFFAFQKARELGVKGGEFEPFSALTVTVPGAAAAWEDTVKMYGKLTLKEVQHNAHS